MVADAKCARLSQRSSRSGYRTEIKLRTSFIVAEEGLAPRHKDLNSFFRYSRFALDPVCWVLGRPRFCFFIVIMRASI